MRDLFSVDFKDIFRGLVFSILSAALVLCLLFIAYTLVFTLITSNPEKVKDVFRRSSLYSDLPVVLYDQASKESNVDGSEIPLKAPEVRRIALEVYNPQFVQENTEKVIDGFYGWLEGNTKQPEINLNFSAQNKEFADKTSVYLKKRAEKLPPCGPGQVQSSDEFNVFQAKCLPATISPEDVKKAVMNTGNELLDAKFTAENIKTADGKPLYENFSNLPESFSVAKTIPPILVVLALIFTTVIIYISKDRVKGLKRVSRVVFGSGILIALLPIIFKLVGENFLKSLSDDDKSIDIVRTLFEEFMRDASKIYYSMGILFILIAAGFYIYSGRLENDNDKIPKLKN